MKRRYALVFAGLTCAIISVFLLLRAPGIQAPRPLEKLPSAQSDTGSVHSTGAQPEQVPHQTSGDPPEGEKESSNHAEGPPDARDAAIERLRHDLLALKQIMSGKMSREVLEGTEFNSVLEEIRSSDPSTWAMIRRFAVEEAGNGFARAEILFQLAKVGDRESTSLLLAQMQDPDPRLRRQIVVAIGALGDSSLGAVLLDRIGAEQDAQVRNALVNAAIMLVPSSLDTRLWGILDSEQDALIRMNVVAALAGKANAQTLSRIERFLEHESNQAVIASGLDALASLKTPDSVGVLTRYVENHPTSEGARDAIRRLAQLRDPSVDRTLVRLLRESSSVETQRSFLGALWGAPISSDLEQVIWGLTARSRPEDVRAAAMRVLKNGSSPDTSRYLAAVALDETESSLVRANAVDALVDRGDDSSLYALQQLVMPGAPTEIRQKAIVGLALNADLASALLVRDFALHDTTPEVRASSVYVMGEIGYLLGPETVQDVLESAKGDKDSEVRGTAIRASTRAAEYRPENLHKLIQEHFGPDADFDKIEKEILQAKEAILGEAKR